MKPDEIKQLLGGYATGTLTADEQKALFDAALQDQKLFDELAREEVLKEALAEPGVRRDLATLLDSPPSWSDRVRAWFRWRYPMAGASALAVAALTVVAIVRYSGPQPHEQVAAAPVVAPSAAARNEPAVGNSKALLAPKQMAVERAAAKDATAPPAPPMAISAPRRLAPAESKAEKASAPVREQVEVSAASAAVPSPSASLQTGMLANIAPASNQARDLFYQTTAVAGGVAGGMPGGVVGGVPNGFAVRAPSDAPATVQALSPFGFRYSVRKAQGSAPQLIVESNADAVLYLFRRGSAGDWLPVTVGGMSLKARTPATTAVIPVDGDAPAPRTLVVLARTPLAQLALTGAPLNAAIDRLRSENIAATVLVQASGGSTYLVMPAPGLAAPLVSPISIP